MAIQEGYTRRLIEIASLVIHEGKRLRLEEIVNGLGMHPLCSTSTMAASTSTMADVSLLMTYTSLCFFFINLHSLVFCNTGSKRNQQMELSRRNFKAI